jgi:hypothetical protein
MAQASGRLLAFNVAISLLVTYLLSRLIGYALLALRLLSTLWWLVELAVVAVGIAEVAVAVGDFVQAQG